MRARSLRGRGLPRRRALEGPETDWVELVPSSALRGGDHNIFEVHDPRRFTHMRLTVMPDGGVARLGVLGPILPDPWDFDGVSIDLVSERNGSFAAGCSDGDCSSPRHLIRSDGARVMGGGWETRRRRDDGRDFVVFGLSIVRRTRQAMVETTCFRYNASESIAPWGSGGAPSPPVGRKRLGPGSGTDGT